MDMKQKLVLFSSMCSALSVAKMTGMVHCWIVGTEPWHQATVMKCFFWNVRHQCGRFMQGFASKEELESLWTNCAVTNDHEFNPENIKWFSTWEAWKDVMPLREIDCILEPKLGVDLSSLPKPGWQNADGQRVSWEYLVSRLQQKNGAFCEITKPSWAEAQDSQIPDKTSKINWLCKVAHKQNMGVVLIFNGADPTKPPFQRNKANKLCTPIYWCQKELKRWPLLKERDEKEKAQKLLSAEKKKAQKLLSAERDEKKKAQKLLSAERDEKKKAQKLLSAARKKVKKLEAEARRRTMLTARPQQRIRILRMRRTAT